METIDVQRIPAWRYFDTLRVAGHLDDDLWPRNSRTSGGRVAALCSAGLGDRLLPARQFKSRRIVMDSTMRRPFLLRPRAGAFFCLPPAPPPVLLLQDAPGRFFGPPAGLSTWGACRSSVLLAGSVPVCGHAVLPH